MPTSATPGPWCARLAICKEICFGHHCFDGSSPLKTHRGEVVRSAGLNTGPLAIPQQQGGGGTRVHHDASWDALCVLGPLAGQEAAGPHHPPDRPAQGARPPLPLHPPDPRVITSPPPGLPSRTMRETVSAWFTCNLQEPTLPATPATGTHTTLVAETSLQFRGKGLKLQSQKGSAAHPCACGLCVWALQQRYSLQSSVIYEPAHPMTAAADQAARRAVGNSGVAASVADVLLHMCLQAKRAFDQRYRQALLRSAF